MYNRLCYNRLLQVPANDVNCCLLLTLGQMERVKTSAWMLRDNTMIYNALQCYQDPGVSGSSLAVDMRARYIVYRMSKFFLVAGTKRNAIREWDLFVRCLYPLNGKQTNHRGHRIKTYRHTSFRRSI